MQIFPQFNSSDIKSSRILDLIGTSGTSGDSDFSSYFAPQFNSQPLSQTPAESSFRTTEAYVSDPTPLPAVSSEKTEKTPVAQTMHGSGEQVNAAEQRSSSAQNNTAQDARAATDKNAAESSARTERASDPVHDKTQTAEQTGNEHKVKVQEKNDSSSSQAKGVEKQSDAVVSQEDLENLKNNLSAMQDLLASLMAKLPADTSSKTAMTEKVAVIQEKIQKLKDVATNIASGKSTGSLSEFGDALKQLRKDIGTLVVDVKTAAAQNAAGKSDSLDASLVKSLSSELAKLNALTDKITAKEDTQVTQSKNLKAEGTVLTQLAADMQDSKNAAAVGTSVVTDKVLPQTPAKDHELQAAVDLVADSMEQTESMLQNMASQEDVAREAQTGKNTAAETKTEKSIKQLLTASRGSEEKAAQKEVLSETGQLSTSQSATDMPTVLNASESTGHAKNTQQDSLHAKQTLLQTVENNTVHKRTDTAEIKKSAQEIDQSVGSSAALLNSSKGQSTAATATQVKAKNAEIARQVENGAFKDLGQGQKQLTIRLDPEDLGQVNVVLQIKGKEVRATLKTTNQETTQALNDQLGNLKTQLENQGLKVTKLEVQTQLPDSQTDAQWQGTEQHNRYQEGREQNLASQRMRNLGRIDSMNLVQDVQNLSYREKVSLSGLDIFA